MDRMKWIVLVAGVALVAGALIAVGSSGTSGGLVGSDELQDLIDNGVRVIDVRTAAEFDGGHIPGAENVPVSDIEAAATGWDTAEPVALYCATGSRSADAAATLRSLGFKTVYDLGGGVAQWRGEIEGGSQGVAEAEPSASGLPVMYEFYTDW